jgi:hypothetical protein
VYTKISAFIHTYYKNNYAIGAFLFVGLLAWHRNQSLFRKHNFIHLNDAKTLGRNHSYKTISKLPKIVHDHIKEADIKNVSL